MASPTQLDRIEKAVSDLQTKVRELTGLDRVTLSEVLTMATNQEVLQAALDQLNTTTSQESDLLTAQTAKLDKIGQLITDLVNTSGVPQSVIDQANAIQAALSGVVSSTTAQAARLDQLGVDPRNPVPTPPPAP
jgi:hypothetical protein